MSKLPSVTGRKAIRAFERAGFTVVRIEGSHHIMSKPRYRYILSIPVHGNRSLGKGLLHRQIVNAGLTDEQFIALL